MEPRASNQQTSFDPVIDSPEFRNAQRARLRAFVNAHVAEYGPIDPRQLAELDARVDEVEARLAEAKRED